MGEAEGDAKIVTKLRDVIYERPLTQIVFELFIVQEGRNAENVTSFFTFFRNYEFLIKVDWCNYDPDVFVNDASHSLITMRNALIT